MGAGRASPAEYGALELRAHTLLEDAPLHDVWFVDLAGGGRDCTVEDVRALLSLERLVGTNRAVRFLFGLRRRLGAIFGWDRSPPGKSEGSYLERLSEAERAASLVAPGTPDGPFRVLFVAPREAVSEVRNATVHAFSVLALAPGSSGLRLYWAIHVRPTGRLTRWYMGLIDPFRRLVIYPALLRFVRDAWAEAAAKVELRALGRDELDAVWSLDRSERIERVYRQDGDRLVLVPERHDVRGWPPGDPERYAPLLDDCLAHGGAAFGVFVGGDLAAAAVLEGRFIGSASDRLQLKWLYVDRAHRGTGLGARLFAEVAARARELGARALYVSSTTSEHTVRFYLARGCRLASKADPELAALEPDDIPLELDLGAPGSARRAELRQGFG